MRISAVVAGSAIAALLCGVALSGCGSREAAAPVVPELAASLPAGLQPQASILDLMLFIDPLAHELWESVAVVSGVSGTEQRQPRNDAKWQALRRKALMLAETANLLVVEGRPVARPGQNLEEPGVERDFTPAQAQAGIDGDRAGFVGFARALQIASGELLKAIDSSSADSFLKAGVMLDEACESCHRRFWYPDSLAPPTDPINPPSASR